MCSETSDATRVCGKASLSAGCRPSTSSMSGSTLDQILEQVRSVHEGRSAMFELDGFKIELEHFKRE